MLTHARSQLSLLIGVCFHGETRREISFELLANLPCREGDLRRRRRVILLVWRAFN